MKNTCIFAAKIRYGELHFSRTLQEHEQAVRVYLPLWEAFDKRVATP